MDKAERLVAVAEMASQAWTQLDKMYAEQDLLRQEKGFVHSGPRDRFEEWLEALTENAKAALAAEE